MAHMRKMFGKNQLQVQLKMTQVRTYLYSSCCQEPPDRLHSTPAIEVVKDWLPCHDSNCLVFLNRNETHLIIKSVLSGCLDSSYTEEMSAFLMAELETFQEYVP